MGNMTCMYFKIEEEIGKKKRKEIMALLEKLRKNTLDISGYGINHQLDDLSITVDWLMNKKEHKAFISIGKQLYDLAHPIYGYAGDEEHFFNDDPPYPNNEEIKEIYNLKIKYIYWVNFFGPKLVKKIGREKLLSAQSWKTEELKDGGILLMLGETPYDLKVEREEVEKYLGL